MLTSKERAKANPLETTLIVGKGGVTEAVVAETDNQLTARELVKGQGAGRGHDDPQRGQRCPL